MRSLLLVVASVGLVVVGCGRSSSPVPAEPRAGGDSSPSGAPMASANGAPAIASPAAADCPAGDGDVYEVGPDQKYKRIVDVPWERLDAGDTVRIHARPEPYREKIHLSSHGTLAQPIRVCGIPGPDGRLPVISAKGAISRRESKFPYVPTQERGLIIVTPRVGYRWGEKPEHIVIQGLDLRDAQANDPFVDSEGDTHQYNDNAASIFVERGEHITVRGCAISNSSYGLFVASGGSEETISREILVEANDIRDCGMVGVDRRHNIYTEAAGILFQYNHLGAPRAGSLGNTLKDRSAGTVIRYNWIEGGAHLLDLVEPEEAAQILCKDPRYGKTFVYGNVMIAGPTAGGSLVHYGGDNGMLPTYRKGTLYFFHNTLYVEAEETKRWFTTLLRLETPEESADVRNNVVFVSGSTHFVLLQKAGKAVFGTNWIGPSYEPWQYPDHLGSISGLDAVKRGSSSPFVDLARFDLHLAAGSSLFGAAGPLAPSLPAEHVPKFQYAPHQRVVPRSKAGAGATLGAFEP